MTALSWLGVLLLAGGPAGAAARGEEETLETILEEYSRAQRKEEGVSATHAGDLIDRIHGVIRDREPDETRFRGLMALMDISSKLDEPEAMEAWTEAADLAVEDFLHSDQIAGLMSGYALRKEPYKKKLRGYLDWILADSSSDAAKAACVYSLGDDFIRQDYEGELEAELRAEAIEIFERLKNEYGELMHPFGRSYQEMAAGAITQLRSLGIGCTAPDIAGADLDLNEFKLSDYRGKVVMLDFWGDW